LSAAEGNLKKKKKRDERLSGLSRRVTEKILPGSSEKDYGDNFHFKIYGRGRQIYPRRTCKIGLLGKKTGSHVPLLRFLRDERAWKRVGED